MNYEQWTLGKIKGSQLLDLGKRVQELIDLRQQVNDSIQHELDFIYATVEARIAKGKEGK